MPSFSVFDKVVAIVSSLLVTATLYPFCASATSPAPKGSLSGSICRTITTVSDGISYTCVKKKWQVTPLGGTIVVLAASSLYEISPAIEKLMRFYYPKSEVIFSFGGSTTLAQQVINGAPADVFLSAGPAPMKIVTDKGVAEGKPLEFATNSLVIAILRKSKVKIETLDDLAKAKSAICTPEVPCGSLSAQLLKLTKSKLIPVTYELNVNAVVTKILIGEVDGGLVYRTDVQSNPNLRGIEILQSNNLKTVYSGVTLPGKSSEKPTREAFVALLNSQRGQEIFAKFGFGRVN